MQKRSVSIYISPRILDRIDQEAKRDNRSRSQWLQIHLETFFKTEPTKPQEARTTETPMRFG